MKKYYLHFVLCTFIQVAFLTNSHSLYAQTPDPSLWKSFVNSSANTLVSDTFRLQTFGDSEWDNWKYSTKGETMIADMSSDNIDNLKGKMGLKLPLPSEICFEHYPLTHSNINISFYFGGKNLFIKGEKLFGKPYRESGITESELANTTADNQPCTFKPISVTKNPYGLDLRASKPAANTNHAYFCLKYALAYGDIPSYSLFSGSGNWSDTLRWSHLPALRHRNALIDGEVTIASDIYCNNILLNEKGKVHIVQGSHLILNNLELYSTDLSLLSEGTLTINGRVTLHKTFEETGKWYFISFPYDVYPDGIDPRFEQKDATPNAGGNYFYAQLYNGDKRALNNQASGNWEVLPIRSGNTPIFEKNKGYLIALDEKATDNTLTFSSRPGDIPSDFGRTGTIAVTLSSESSEINQDNHGWYLCGNPLPSPLSLSRLGMNTELDGKAYIYTNTGYTSYSLNTQSALPPFSTFFVKASKETELQISTSHLSPDSKLITLSSSLNKPQDEPNTKEYIVSNTTLNTKIQYRITNNSLYIENPEEEGTLILMDLTGRYLIKETLSPGLNTIHLTFEKGVYFLSIQIRNHHIRKKLSFM